MSSKIEQLLNQIHEFVADFTKIEVSKSECSLKQYFLEHREDKIAFQAYLERRRRRSSGAIAKVGDPDFDSKIEAAIRQKLQHNQS